MWLCLCGRGVPLVSPNHYNWFFGGSNGPVASPQSSYLTQCLGIPVSRDSGPFLCQFTTVSRVQSPEGRKVHSPVAPGMVACSYGLPRPLLGIWCYRRLSPGREACQASVLPPGVQCQPSDSLPLPKLQSWASNPAHLFGLLGPLKTLPICRTWQRLGDF